MAQEFYWPGEFPGVHWINREEEAAVLDVLRNGSLFRYYGVGTPTYVDSFERAAKDFYGARYALGVNSGTGALLCSMKALGIGPGAEVIVPAFMWVATVAAAVECGAIPVICEVDSSFTLDPADLEKKITARTRLIVPVHIAGAPCDMEAVMAIARKHGIAVLEDCAQCNGGSYRGKKVGTIGDMGIFSLQLNKNMTAGEGGLIITDDEKLYQRAFSAHDMGLTRKNGRLAAAEDYAQMWGEGRRMNEMCGAVALVQLGKLPKITAAMRASKSRILNMLENCSGLAFRKIHDPAGDSGPFIIMLFDRGEQAVKAADAMLAGGLHNVFRLADYGLHIYYNIRSLTEKLPLSEAGDPWKHPANRKSCYDYHKGACPQSDELFSRAVLIPVPSCLSEEQEKQAAAIIRAAAK